MACRNSTGKREKAFRPRFSVMKRSKGRVRCNLPRLVLSAISQTQARLTKISFSRIRRTDLASLKYCPTLRATRERHGSPGETASRHSDKIFGRFIKIWRDIKNLIFGRSRNPFALRSLNRNQPDQRIIVFGDDNVLSLQGPPENFREMGFGLGNIPLCHTCPLSERNHVVDGHSFDRRVDKNKGSSPHYHKE